MAEDGKLTINDLGGVLYDLEGSGVHLDKLTIEISRMGNLRFSASHYNQSKESLRALKAVFGPFKTHYYQDGGVGWHTGTSADGHELTYYGLYECKVERYEEETVEVPAVEAQPAKTEVKKKPVYYCGPAALPKD